MEPSKCTKYWRKSADVAPYGDLMSFLLEADELPTKIIAREIVTKEST